MFTRTFVPLLAIVHPPLVSIVADAVPAVAVRVRGAAAVISALVGVMITVT